MSKSEPPLRPAPNQAFGLPTGADKRERILNAAEHLFFRYGYLGTTLDMICSELGVTKPFVYYYFKDKQEIFETLTWQASVAVLTAMKFPAGDTRAAHVKLADGLQRFMASNVANFRAGTFAYRDKASLSPAFLAKLQDLARDFYADLCALMDAGRAEGHLSFTHTRLTAMAIGSVGGFMYTWYQPDGSLPPEEMARELTAILYKMVGLSAKPENRS